MRCPAGTTHSARLFTLWCVQTARDERAERYDRYRRYDRGENASRIRAAIVAANRYDRAIRRLIKVADDSEDEMNVNNSESEMKYCCVTDWPILNRLAQQPLQGVKCFLYSRLSYINYNVHKTSKNN
jgi:hypothetical protein